MEKLPKFEDENLLVGFDTSDDACVYRLSDDLVAVQTVDFFPPIVDDPYRYGQIAAANALSDIYAMGAEPKFCMNLLCVPNCLSLNVVQEILRGGYDKVREAGAIIAGGHTIEDEEPKYGLCVSAFVHPSRILKNSGAEVGDGLVLTKPIGSGILTTAAKADLLDEEALNHLADTMATLNRYAAEGLDGLHPHGCTDITGFGLMGHCYEMASGSGHTIRLHTQAVPYYPQAYDYAKMGIIPAGAYRNFDYVKEHIRTEEGVEQAAVDLLCDPQTSGGLLISLPMEEAQEYQRRMEGKLPCCAMIGEVLEKGPEDIVIGK